ncbi:MAG: DUF4351 domain-containing protein, partial [Cyanobacteriota bacterium]
MSILEDSSVYQYIVRKGLELGLELGRQQEAVTLLLRLLERLEELGLALLDFQGAADLAAWLG